MSIYLQMLKSWFKQKITREDFDHEARSLLSTESVHLHNQFLLAILTKCQNIGSSLLSSDHASQTSSDKQQKKEKSKRKLAIYHTGLHQRFLAADPLCQAPVIQPQFPEQNDRVPDYATREMLLPDIAMVHGRLVVTAWEFGLDSVDDDAVHLLMMAVESELKTLISVTLSRRRAFKLREKRFRYAISSEAPSVQLRNAHSWSYSDTDCGATSVTTQGLHAPSLKPSLALAQRDAAVRLACSDPRAPVYQPITLFDLLEALQVHMSALPSHTVYTLNMERLLDRLSHPTNEELLQQEIRKSEAQIKRKISAKT